MSRFSALFALFFVLFPLFAFSQTGTNDPGPVDGSPKFCPGGVFTYAIQPLPGATQYLWFAPPGSAINGSPSNFNVVPAPGGNTVSIEFGAMGGQVCVEVVGINHGDTSSMSCLAVSPVALPPTVLPPLVINMGDCADFFGQPICSTGTYQTTLTASTGCDSIVQQQIIVRNCTYEVQIDGLASIPCGATVAELTCAGTPPPSVCTWYLPNGNAIAGPTLTATVEGFYALYAVSPTGCPVSQAFKVFFDATPAIANAGPDAALGCSLGSTVALDGSESSAGPNIVFHWEGPGINANNESLSNPSVEQIGTYILTVENPDNNCSDTDTVVVSPNAGWPNANAGPDQMLACNAPHVVLDGSNSSNGGVFSFAWAGPGIHAGNDNALSPTVSNAGTYVLTIENTLENCIAKDTALVGSDANLPTADAGADANLICKTSEIRIGGTATSGSGHTFLWTGPGVVMGQASKKRPLVNAAGVYTLLVTRNADGCQAQDETTVGPPIPPTASAGPDVTLDCQNSDGISLSSGASIIPSGSGYKALWTGPGIDQINATSKAPAITVPGIYTVTITDSGTGCTDDDDVEVLQDAALPTCSAGPDMAISPGNPVVLQGYGDAGGASIQYIWSGPGITPANRNLQMPAIGAPGNYVLRVKNTATGCYAKDRVIVIPTAPLAENSDRAQENTHLRASISPNPCALGEMAVLQLENFPPGETSISAFDALGRRQPFAQKFEIAPAENGAQKTVLLPTAPLARGHYIIIVSASSGQRMAVPLLVH